LSSIQVALSSIQVALFSIQVALSSIQVALPAIRRPSARTNGAAGASYEPRVGVVEVGDGPGIPCDSTTPLASAFHGDPCVAVVATSLDEFLPSTVEPDFEYRPSANPTYGPRPTSSPRRKSAPAVTLTKSQPEKAYVFALDDPLGVTPTAALSSEPHARALRAALAATVGASGASRSQRAVNPDEEIGNHLPSQVERQRHLKVDEPGQIGRSEAGCLPGSRRSPTAGASPERPIW
jgi:hypothetical protein